jgi:dUTP pyrophosphatase
MDNASINHSLNSAVMAQTCPVCNGTTNVISGFYHSANNMSSASTNVYEKCKSCYNGLVYINPRIIETRKQIDIHLELCHPDAKLPTYANEGDSGVDVYAVENITIYPQETKIVKIGLKTVIPNGYEIQVRPRSGISFYTPLRISNAPGTVDSKFRDEIGIIITNTSNKDVGFYNLNEKNNNHGTYQILKGDRIAQLVLCEVPKMKFVVVNNVLDMDSTNRGGGYGSSGIRQKYNFI